MTTFTTMTEATDYIATSLGDFAPDFDIDAIAEEVTDWVDGRLTLIADNDAYWNIVAKHDTSC